MEKLGDNKIMVRQAAIQVLRNAMNVANPALLLGLLSEGLQHNSWRVREECMSLEVMVRTTCMPLTEKYLQLANLLTACLEQVLLTAERDKIKYIDMVAVFVEGCNDPKDRVRLIALEGLSLLESQLGGAHCRELMSLAKASPQVISLLRSRCRLSRLPFINKEGFVEYEVNTVEISWTVRADSNEEIFIWILF